MPSIAYSGARRDSEPRRHESWLEDLAKLIHNPNHAPYSNHLTPLVDPSPFTDLQTPSMIETNHLHGVLVAADNEASLIVTNDDLVISENRLERHCLGPEQRALLDQLAEAAQQYRRFRVISHDESDDELVGLNP
jgi:hypothetical protein